MRRAKVSTLTNNANASALETARAALDANSGQAVTPGGQVGFTIEPATGEQLVSGDMVGFAYVHTVVNTDGSLSSAAWRRWPGGDFAIVAGIGMIVGPKEVPPGASKVIALPLAVVDSAASSAFSAGVFFYAPATVG